MEDALRAALVAQGFELIETHISRVYLRGDTVYKTKRPVDLGFLDFTTLEARERACAAEVTLNRRLAPDVYLGVVAIVADGAGGFAFRARDRLAREQAIEWAVHMRRLADRDRADIRLSRGLLDRGEIEAIAQRLVRFHQGAAREAAIAQFGRREQVSANVEENFTQVAGLTGELVSERELRAIEAYQRDFLLHNAALFEQRAAAGWVRDGHGDLRLEHVYRSDAGEHVIIDCIEFNERFRFADVCADLGFLSMDLRFHQRPDLADLLLAEYARESGDFALYRLIDFYESYRAFVRAKVAAFLAHDSDVGEASRFAAASNARRYFLLALAAARPPASRPRLIATMGLIASGKTSVAEALATRAGLCVLSADRVRKELLGVDPRAPLHDEAFSGAYAPEVSAQVYARLRERASLVLRSGRSVIVDATFRARGERDLAVEAALDAGADVLFLECRCPPEVTRARLRARAQAPSVSDGRAEVYEAVARSSEPVDELLPTKHVLLDTTLPLERTVEIALGHLR
jgi:aminoglycoside phosphotransferase family enzyme/predicted kinase